MHFPVGAPPDVQNQFLKQFSNTVHNKNLYLLSTSSCSNIIKNLSQKDKYVRHFHVPPYSTLYLLWMLYYFIYCAQICWSGLWLKRRMLSIKTLKCKKSRKNIYVYIFIYIYSQCLEKCTPTRAKKLAKGGTWWALYLVFGFGLEGAQGKWLYFQWVLNNVFF